MRAGFTVHVPPQLLLIISPAILFAAVTPPAPDGVASNVTIQLAAFAPHPDNQDYGLHLIAPCLELAIQTAYTHILPDYIQFNLSHWSTPEPDRVLLQFLLDRRQHPLVCVGPVNDVRLEYVARMSAFKSIPVITPGGLNINFGVSKTKSTSIYDRKRYETLIRLGHSHNHLSICIINLFITFKFKKMKVLIEKHDTVLDNCFHLYGALDYYLNLHKKYDDPGFRFDAYLMSRNFSEAGLLLTEVSTEYASKSPLYLPDMWYSHVDGRLHIQSDVFHVAFRRCVNKYGVRM